MAHDHPPWLKAIPTGRILEIRYSFFILWDFQRCWQGKARAKFIQLAVCISVTGVQRFGSCIFQIVLSKLKKITRSVVILNWMSLRLLSWSKHTWSMSRPHVPYPYGTLSGPATNFHERSASAISLQRGLAVWGWNTYIAEGYKVV